MPNLLTAHHILLLTAELGAAAATLRKLGPKQLGEAVPPLCIASDKSASGHTEPSAGLVGLLTALRATHEQVCVFAVGCSSKGSLLFTRDMPQKGCLYILQAVKQHSCPTQAAQPLMHLTNLNPHLAAVMEASGEKWTWVFVHSPV